MDKKRDAAVNAAMQLGLVRQDALSVYGTFVGMPRLKHQRQV